MTGSGQYRSRKTCAWENTRENSLKEQRGRNVEAAAAGCAVYVRGVPASWSAKQLQDFFSDRWPVESVNVMPRRPPNRAKAAFVNFTTREDAEAAVAECDNHVVEDAADGGEVYWLACSLKKDAHKKVDVAACDFNVPSEILEDFLFLGNRNNARDWSCLESVGISHMLSVYAESDEEVITPPGIERLILHADDLFDADISACFTRAIDFLECARKAHGRVLVHCIAGRSRSPSLVLAYLMHARHMKLGEAFAFLKDKRPAALPNPGFWRQLEEEELKIFGQASPTPLQYRRQSGSEDCPVDRAYCISKPTYLQGDKVCMQRKKERCNGNPDENDFSAHLPAGALANAPGRLLHDFHSDLGQFSKLHSVSATTYLPYDAVGVRGCFSQEQIAACQAELQQILEFYGFGGGIRWAYWQPSHSRKDNASLDCDQVEDVRVSRW